MTNLDDLGPRICILGPSNSGKSTLANAISRQRGLPVVHLDRLFHEPHTDWEPRRAAEFARLHDEAILGQSWIMEGNYTRLLPQRLARATGFILLDVSTATSLFRYFRRTWFERDRAGALEGAKDSVKWLMIRHIAVVTPPNRRKQAAMFQDIDLPKLKLMSPAAINRFYQREQLDT